MVTIFSVDLPLLVPFSAVLKNRILVLFSLVALMRCSPIF